MSLIHWWPLNGDTQDKIGNKHGTLLGTATLTESGKLGTCLSAGDGTQITAGVNVANCNLLDEISDKYSAAMWIKVHGTHVHYEGAFISSGNWNNQRWTFGINQANNRIQPLTNASNQNFISLGKTLVTDQWYHVVTTYEDGKAYLYLDGELIGSVTATAPYQSSATNLCIGRETYASGYFSFNGDICDVRIYDHALSQAEVKELSKALVVHYTFDDICAKPTTNLLPITQQTQSNSAATINVTNGLVNGATYTLSTYITRDPSCTSTNPRLTLRFFYSDGTNTAVSKYNDGGVSYPKDGVERYYFITATANPTKTLTAVGGWLMDHSSGSGKKMTATRSQLEISEYPTPYTPTTRASMIRNEAETIQPSTISNIALTTDSASGTFSLSCTGNTMINTPISGDTSSGATISCWIKTPTYPSANSVVFTDYNSKLAFGFYGTQNAIISCGGYSAPYISNIKSSWVDGWNHVVVTIDNSGTISCYLNGAKLSTTGSNNWSSTSGYSTIGGRYNGSYTTYFTGYVDDYRVYHTLLSDTDIQDLYKTKAYVTNKSDIETHQFIEGKTQAQVTSKYCFEADEFYEELYSGYDVLEYIESTGTQYVDTGYITTSTDYTYELDFTPTKIGGFYSYMGFMASGTTPRAGIHEYSNVFMLGANATTNSSTTPVVNERVVLKGHFKSGAQKLYKNDVLIASNSTSFNHSANTLSTYIFGRNYSSGRNLTSIKLYSAKIYEGSTLVHYYIPARRQSDDALGLYDILTNTFCANSGSGTFTSGSAITNKNASIYEDHHVSGREIIEI